MKRVYNRSDEVAHLWTNQVQSDARSRNTSFNGTEFFSYSTCIAKLYNRDDGKELILLSSYNYSSTTSGHKYDVRRAASHKRIIEVPLVSCMGREHDQNYEWMLKTHAELLQIASRARQRKEQHLAAANRLIQDMYEYSAFFNLAWNVPTSLEMSFEQLAEHHARIEKIEEKRRAQRIAGEAERLRDWLDGGRSYYFSEMRLRVKDEEIQTSHGANIPIDHAIKLWPFIVRAHESGEAFLPSEHRTIHLGHYKFNGFSDDVLVVGCHRIPYSELERMAGQLGLLEAAAA